MGISRIVYGCSCCGKEFNPPSYHDADIGILSYTRVFNRESMGNHKHTLGINDTEVYLCFDCKEKLELALYQIGFKLIFDGCTSLKLRVDQTDR